MKTSIWIEILVGGIILGLLLWLLSSVFDIKGTVGSIDGTLNETCQRVDRIAKILPDLRIRIAQEELRKPIEIAIITTKPVKVSPENWISAVHVMDTHKMQLTTFEVKLDNPDDITLPTLITGITKRLAVDALSFYELASCSSELGETWSLPMYIDDSASFVLHMTPDKFTENFKILNAPSKTYSLKFQANTWVKLQEEIKTNVNIFKIK